MQPILKQVLRGGLALVLLAVVLGLWQREKITRLMAVNSLFAEEKIVANFISMDSMFDTAPLATAPTPNRLARGTDMAMPAGFATWAEDRAVTGIVVLKDGNIRHETYPMTAQAEDDPAASRRISWSVAKSFLSVLVGVLKEDGSIESLDDPVVKYAPALAGSAYHTATLRDVLQMASGVTFNEDYLDFNSDINRMGRILALGGSMDGFAENLQDTFAEPGTDWRYVSIDTHVVGMVVRGATGRSIPDLLGEKVIAPLGLSQQPYYITDGHGVAFVLGGLNLTTRDYALFGHMIASGGISFGTRIVSDDWIIQSTRASAPTDASAIGYGYQWWIPAGATDGQFMARGIYGQYIYIDRPRGVVIAVNGADRRFRDDGVSRQNIAMFRAIAEALD